jgi:membrane-bound acyltransferase YfiQ involved in biofilm formation
MLPHSSFSAKVGSVRSLLSSLKGRTHNVLLFMQKIILVSHEISLASSLSIRRVGGAIHYPCLFGHQISLPHIYVGLKSNCYESERADNSAPPIYRRILIAFLGFFIGYWLIDRSVKLDLHTNYLM